jgi:hypothetical protein
MKPRRDIVICPTQYSILDPDHAEVICAVSDSSPELRVNDRIVIVDEAGNLANPALWRIASLEAIPNESSNPDDASSSRLYRCDRVGKINDPNVVRMLP